MSHTKNERIAKILRAMAGRIEQSPHEYSSSMSAYGGEPLSFAADGEPVQFGPIGWGIVLGDADFVASRAVVNIMDRVGD